MAEPEWTCKVDEGAAGVHSARWSADGQHILIVANFHIRLTVWSLVGRTCLHLPGPKLGTDVAFSHDGSMLALAEVMPLPAHFHKAHPVKC